MVDSDERGVPTRHRHCWARVEAAAVVRAMAEVEPRFDRILLPQETVPSIESVRTDQLRGSTTIHIIGDSEQTCLACEAAKHEDIDSYTLLSTIRGDLHRLGNSMEDERRQIAARWNRGFDATGEQFRADVLATAIKGDPQ